MVLSSFVPTSLVDMLVTCDRDVVDEKMGKYEERYDGETMSDALFVTYQNLLHNGQFRVGRII